LVVGRATGKRIGSKEGGWSLLKTYRSENTQSLKESRVEKKKRGRRDTPDDNRLKGLALERKRGSKNVAKGGKRGKKSRREGWRKKKLRQREGEEPQS